MTVGAIGSGINQALYKPMNKYSSHGRRNVSAESHGDAAEKFALAEARRKYGRTGRVGSVTACARSQDGRLQEWSAFIGNPAYKQTNATDGHAINFTTFRK